jgi:protein SCO1/2
VTLGELLGQRPAVLALVYFDCPNLCNVTLSSLRRALEQVDLKAGRDFDVIALSFDAREGTTQAAAKRASLLGTGRGSSTPGWHFLTGESSQITEVSKAVGFRFIWDAERSQFAHPAGITIITPRGRIARYFGGVEFPPRELRWALLEAARDRTTTGTDRLWLLCYHYADLVGRYSGQILTSLRFLASAAVLALAFLLWRLTRNQP